jgi:hypothetical protein
MNAALSRLSRRDKPARLTLAVCRLALTAEMHNLDLLERVKRKVAVEECLALSAKGWASLPPSGVWRWENVGGTVAFSFDPTLSVLHLGYVLEVPAEQQRESVAYSVQMEAQSTRFGGVRWWFICPLAVNGRPCNCRVGKLYLPPGGTYFGCRQCHGLSYASSQGSRKKDRRCATNSGTQSRTLMQVVDRAEPLDRNRPVIARLVSSVSL